MTIKKTSQEWFDEIKEFCDILDPDGWDRKNLLNDWSKEITKDEFLDKLLMSTVKGDIKKISEWARKDK